MSADSNSIVSKNFLSQNLQINQKNMLNNVGTSFVIVAGDAKMPKGSF
jgi:hypothetical protein